MEAESNRCVVESLGGFWGSTSSTVKCCSTGELVSLDPELLPNAAWQHESRACAPFAELSNCHCDRRTSTECVCVPSRSGMLETLCWRQNHHSGGAVQTQAALPAPHRAQHSSAFGFWGGDGGLDQVWSWKRTRQNQQTDLWASLGLLVLRWCIGKSP